jgi:glucosamine--fructose-6-phosphate aminotransferase (isomerizing)
MLGVHFETEIRQQPGAWRKLAGTDLPVRLAAALEADEICFIGSGSSLIAAELGAIAMMRCGMRATALAATEAAFAIEGLRDATVVAISQSGQSGDVLKALDMIAPSRLVAITNDPESPLAARADDLFSLDVGIEEAIPSTKSTSTTHALLLLAASQRMGTLPHDAAALLRAADGAAMWLGSENADMPEAARAVAGRRSVAILGSGYGLPVARELALKLKEASYLHAEAFAAGEFRHGNVAMLDETYTVLAVADRASKNTVAGQLGMAREFGALLFAMGADIEGTERLGPILEPPFDLLGCLVAGQMLALHVARARFVDSDAPRGLSKYVR